MLLFCGILTLGDSTLTCPKISSKVEVYVPVETFGLSSFTNMKSSVSDLLGIISCVFPPGFLIAILNLFN